MRPPAEAPDGTSTSKSRAMAVRTILVFPSEVPTHYDAQTGDCKCRKSQLECQALSPAEGQHAYDARAAMDCRLVRRSPTLNRSGAQQFPAGHLQGAVRTWSLIGFKYCEDGPEIIPCW